jgi:seryl-tRNA synthetase
MLDPAYVRDNIEIVRAGLRNRGLDPDKALEDIATLQALRRRLIPEVEGLKREQNTAGDEVAKAKRRGLDTAPIQEANRARAQQIKQLGVKLDSIEHQLERQLLTLPNLPHASVPVGKSAEDNQEVRRHGTPRTFEFEPRPHWELGAALGILDFERAAKIAGARFAVLSGAGARLSRALINFMLDLHTTEHGYREVEPPFMANSAALTGTGNLPKFEADLFKIAGDWDLYLIPTAEVPLTNLHRAEILDARELPIRYTAYTPCFRSEAGSYGQDVRGLIRQHQFDKVELVKLTTAERSYDELESLTANAEEVLKRLELPYRTCSCARATWDSRRENLRHRSVAAEPEHVSRDFLVQQHRDVPGAAGEHQGAGAGCWESGIRPHLERFRAGRRPDADCHPREFSAAGWLGRDSGGTPPVHGRRRCDPAVVKSAPYPTCTRGLRSGSASA